MEQEQTYEQKQLEYLRAYNQANDLTSEGLKDLLRMCKSLVTGIVNVREYGYSKKRQSNVFILMAFFWFLLEEVAFGFYLEPIYPTLFIRATICGVILLLTGLVYRVIEAQETKREIKNLVKYWSHKLDEIEK